MVESMNATAVGDLLGVGVRQIRRLVASGRLTRSDPGGFRADDVSRYITNRLRGPLVGSEVRLAKSRAERAQRLLAEVLAAQISAATIARDLSTAVAHWTGIFEMIPDAVADLATATTPGQCAEILEVAVFAALFLAAEPVASWRAPVAAAVPLTSTPQSLRDWTQLTAESRASIIDARERIETGADVLVADVESKLVASLQACRARLLAIPTSLAPLVAVETDAEVCRELVAARVAEAVAELA